MSDLVAIETNHDTFMKVLCSYNGAVYSEMLGTCFYYYVGDEIVACDNQTGMASLGSFVSLADCLKWFEQSKINNENQIMFYGESLIS